MVEEENLLMKNLKLILIKVLFACFHKQRSQIHLANVSNIARFSLYELFVYFPFKSLTHGVFIASSCGSKMDMLNAYCLRIYLLLSALNLLPAYSIR